MTGEMQPLAGVRVADFGQLTAGANSSAMLADLGADVIKIESAAYMDLFRFSQPPDPSIDWWNRSPQFHFTNRNKRGVAIDIKQPAGRMLVLNLVEKCDILIENYSRGVLDRVGLGYEAVAKRNPRIVYASITAQGETGPYRMHRTFGSTLEAMGGLAALNGYVGDKPIISGGEFNYPDQVVSLFAAGQVIAALREARRSGRGGHLDITQREIVSFLLGEEISVAAADQAADCPPRPRGNDDGEFLQDCFCAADGRWIAVTIDDARAVSALRRIIGEGDPHDAFRAWVAARTADAAVCTLQQQGIIAGCVKNSRDLVGSPELFGVSLARSDEGTLYKGMPYALDGAPFTIHRAAPDLGADTGDVLRDILHLQPEEIAALEADGVTSNAPKAHRGPEKQ